MVTPLTPILGAGRRRDLRPEADQRRQCLLAAIRDHPGLAFRGVCRVTGVPTGTAHHHLASLRGLGLVVAYQGGSSTRYFPAGWDGTQAANHLLADGGSLERVLDVLKGQLLNQKTIVLATGLPRATTQHALKRLVTAGAVVVHAEGRYRFYKVTP